MRRYYIAAAVVVVLLVIGGFVDHNGVDLSGLSLALTWAAFIICVLITASYGLLLNFQVSSFGRQTFAGYVVVAALIGTSLLRQVDWPERDAVTSVIMGVFILLGAMREAMILRKGGVNGRVPKVSRPDGGP